MAKTAFLGLAFLMFASRLGYAAAMETPPGAAMFVLGDSSVDCGYNNPFNGVLHLNLSRFPCNGSDTTLLPQLLAKKMGLPYTTPFYSQNSSQNGSIEVILGGVNFGSAEATILHPGSRNYQSLNEQLRQAFEIIQLLQLQLGEVAANAFINSSVFYLSFGKDDFTDFFHNNSLGNGSLTRILVNQMTNAIRSLYTSNVRKIICVGVLPLGCAPHASPAEACLEEINNMVWDYNRLLEENIVGIDAELDGASVVFCDVYRGVMELIENPEKYGMKDVRNACCGGVREGEMIGCVSTEMACGEASSYVWWDLYNLTPAVNSLLADSAWSEYLASSICRPYSLRHLLSSSP